jgi:CBS domain-containing protein
MWSHFTTNSTCVSPKTPAWKAWKVLCDFGHEVLPVHNGNRVVGVIQEKDLFPNPFHEQDSLEVETLMKPNPLLVCVNDMVLDVIQLLVSQKKPAAVVVNKKSQVLGIFTLHQAQSLAKNIVSNSGSR